MDLSTKAIVPYSEVTPVQQMIASCTGSFITSILVTPLDVVKIRLQAQQKEFMRNKCFLYCNGLMDHVCFCLNGQNNNGKQILCPKPEKRKVYDLFKTTNTTQCSYHSISVKNLTEQQIKDLWYRRPNYFNGTLDAFIKISRNEGITSLWSGLPPTLVMAIPATVMYFTVYDQIVYTLRKRLNIPRDTIPYLCIPVIAGGTARLFAATLISPLEMIRTKMQSQKLSYHEIGKAVSLLIKTEGIFRMWNGLNATLLRDVPFSCLYWLNYENFKRYFNKYDYSFSFSFIAGAISGSIAAIITLPFDVVKTHRQIELGHQLAASKSVPSKKTVDILKKIYQERGYRGLFAGIAPRLIKVAPACAIMISTYEAGKAFFRNYNRNKLIQQQALETSSGHKN